MKDKPNEWVAVSDLMSGVMAVVMLMLVVAVLQKNYMVLQHKQVRKLCQRSARQSTGHRGA